LAIGGAASAGAYRVPHLSTGQPDLEGVWSTNSTTKLERAAAYPSLVISEAQARTIPPPPVFPDDDVGQESSEWQDPGWTLARIGSEIRTSWIVDPLDGRLPYTEAARAQLKQPYSSDGPEGRSNNDRCLTFMQSGPPMLNAGGSNTLQILQAAKFVVILMEGNHEARIIPLTAGATPPFPEWLGHPHGRYKGDTLVVETSGFHPGQSRRMGAFSRLYMSPAAVVTERFTRISDRQILYRYTVHDPEVFTRDWTAEMPLNATSGLLYEMGCHEGNYSMSGILAGARAEERRPDAPAAPAPR
jgi:hypothetical protein